VSKQTEAQRLAGALAASYSNDERLVHAAAKELRRLSAANADLKEMNAQLREQNTEVDQARAKLEAANAELLEFVREYLSNWGDLDGYLQTIARAAIAKHGGAACQ
jgi:cell division protein FtsB